MTVLADKVAVLAKDRLADLGFKKRAGAIFTKDLDTDVLGWLGFNAATEHLPKGVVEINPVVGVRFQQVERVVADLEGIDFHPYLPATISSPIGYLMPERKYKGWIVDTNAAGALEAVTDLVTTIETAALPFMDSARNLEMLPKFVDEVGGFEHQLRYRRPVALMLAGDPARALKDLDGSVERLGARNDPAATRFRRFAERLRRRLVEERQHG